MIATILRTTRKDGILGLILIRLIQILRLSALMKLRQRGSLPPQDPNAWYAIVSGTSFAAPHVAGVAALALGKCPAFSYDTLKSRILNYGETLDSLDGKCVSGKRLNAYGVVHDPSNPTTPSAPSNLGASSTSWNRVHLWWTDGSTNEESFEVQRYGSDKPAFMRYQSVGPNMNAFAAMRMAFNVGLKTTPARALISASGASG
jgi:hypothetical protein